MTVEERCVSELQAPPQTCHIWEVVDGVQVESLAASREAAGSAEPADSVRAVNALLTQLDTLKVVLLRVYFRMHTDRAHRAYMAHEEVVFLSRLAGINGLCMVYGSHPLT